MKEKREIMFSSKRRESLIMTFLLLLALSIGLWFFGDWLQNLSDSMEKESLNHQSEEYDVIRKNTHIDKRQIHLHRHEDSNQK